MKKITLCLISALFAAQVQAVNFRTSSDNSPRIRGTESQQYEEPFEEKMCVTFERISTLSNGSREPTIVGQCADGKIWVNISLQGWELLPPKMKEKVASQ